MTNTPIEQFTSAMDELDDFFQMKLAHLTYGLSPAGLVQMYATWLSQLSLCPGRLASLAAFPIRLITCLISAP